MSIQFTFADTTQTVSPNDPTAYETARGSIREEAQRHHRRHSALLEEKLAVAEAENEKLWMELEKFLRVKEKDDDAPEPAPAAPAAAEPAAAAPAPPAVDPVTEKERQRLEEEVSTTKKRGRRYDLPRASGSFAGRGARDAQLPQHAAGWRAHPR